MAVIHPIAEKPDEELLLPGSLQAYEESPIFARTNGYLLRWYKDIGSRVNKGDCWQTSILLKSIRSCCRRARHASRFVAQLDLAKIRPTAGKTCARPIRFRSRKPISRPSGYQQATGQSRRSRRQRQAAGRAGAFKHVYAPFSGVLTRRNVDPGALINAGATTGKELFDIARVDPLRVYVSVPQAYAPAIKSRHERDRDLAGVSRAEIHGHGRAHRGVHRPDHSYPAD